MSIYYLLINKTLKEFLCSGCIKGYGVHQYAYKKGPIGNLLFLLTITKWDWLHKEKEKQYSITDDFHNIEGHWRGSDDIRLVSEHEEEYWQAKCINDPEDKIQDYGYMNVTPPAVMEFNDYCNDEDKLELEICSTHRDKSSNHWRDKK